MRLIDADEVTRGIEQLFCSACDDWNGVKCRACDVAECIRTIDDTNTIDAKTVKHGTWRKGENFGGEFCDCSVCNVRHYNVSFWKYCPNCGAKMDGGMKK